MKFNILTLGCKVNSCDSDTIAGILKLYGYSQIEESNLCDIVIINTCAVTAESERKSRQLIRKTKGANPSCKLIVCGCWSRVSKDPEKNVPEADLIIKKSSAEECALEIIKFVEPNADISSVEDIWCSGGKLKEDAVRAAVKIQDGCNRYCTYCIIPYARKALSSVRVDKVVEDVKALCESGCKEIVLTGIHIASYNDCGKRLIDVIEAVSKETNIQRIRLGSLEPKLITQDFVDRLKKVENFCSHFHLSLQSGSEGVLKRMNRRYTPEEYLSYCNLIRENIPNATFTTDIIVGFPSESEEEFVESLEFVKKVGFTHVHIFPYSQRQGTPAADYPNQIAKSEKHSRVKRMQQVCEEVSERQLTKYIGETFNVLCEQVSKDNLGEGYSENYIRVVFNANSDCVNNICRVKITKVCHNMLYGQLI